MSKKGALPEPPNPETVRKLLMPLVGPQGPFTLSVNSRGRYFVKAPATMAHFYVNQFNEHNEAPCLVYRDERYSFQDVWSIARKLGAILQSQYQIQRGDRVAIAMRNYPEWCLAFLACGTIGAVAVPLNSFWKGKEMVYGLQDSGSKVLFCDGQRFEHLAPYVGQLGLTVVLVRGGKNIPLTEKIVRYEDLVREMRATSQVMSNEEVLVNSASIQPDDAAMIMYTSGTTGNPKGVVLTHRSIMTQMENLRLLTLLQEKISELPGMPPLPQVKQHSILCVVPLFHVTGSHHNFLQSIMMGRKMVMMYKWDAEVALQLVESERITQWTGVPTMVLDMMECPNFHKYDTSSLLSIGSGGAATPAPQVKRTAMTFKNGLPTSAYGLTETNGAVCMNSPLTYLRKPTSCGTPFPIVEMKVVDLETGQEVAPGERGELLVKSNLVMKEYWNKPEATRQAITEDGYFRTGDIAILDQENFVYIVDRAKDIIIRGGENISCTEIEDVIYTNPAVRECAVFGVPDARLGETVGVLIMLKKPLTAEELVSFLQGKLAQFKIPAAEHVYFTKNPLPRGATGKIVKRAIRDQLIQKVNLRSRL